MRGKLSASQKIMDHARLVEDAKALEGQLSVNGLFEDEFESVTGKVVRIIHCPGCVTAGVRFRPVSTTFFSLTALKSTTRAYLLLRKSISLTSFSGCWLFPKKRTASL